MQDATMKIPRGRSGWGSPSPGFALAQLSKKAAPVSLGLNRGRLVRSCRVPQEGPLGTEHGYKIPAITSATIVL